MSENKVNLPEGQRDGALGHGVAVRSIEIVTAEIHTIRDNVARVFMDGVVQIGRRLEEVKQLVPQGEWLAYLDKELGYKPSTAQNYMRIAREFGDGQIGMSGKTPSDFFGNLGYSQLLPLLGLPEEEREALAEEHDLAGMSSREIQALVKERDEAKAAAAAAREQADEQGQEARRARDALASAEDALKAEQEKNKAQADAARANAQTAAELQRQLDELEAKAGQPRPLTDEEREALRAEIAAEQADARGRGAGEAGKGEESSRAQGQLPVRGAVRGLGAAAGSARRPGADRRSGRGENGRGDHPDGERVDGMTCPGACLCARCARTLPCVDCIYFAWSRGSGCGEGGTRECRYFEEEGKCDTV